MRYPAPGDPALAARAADLLGRAGFQACVDPRRGLDHGAWVPLLLAWPEADIPVVQVPLQPRLGPAHHVLLGRALAPLRAGGMLLLGSGSFTHDLTVTSPYQADAAGALPSPDWVNEFCAWIDTALLDGRIGDAVHYRERAPYDSETIRPRSTYCHYTSPLAPAVAHGGCIEAKPTACCAPA